MDNAIKQGLVKAKPIPANDTVSFSISAVIDPKTGILLSCCFFKSAEMLMCLQLMSTSDVCVSASGIYVSASDTCVFVLVTSVCLQVMSLYL